MINLYKYNKTLSLIIFFFSLTSFAFVNLKSDTPIITLICFFLIATVGVSHGSLDHLKGYKVLKFYKIKEKIKFYLAYIFFSLVVILFWLNFPYLILVLFLLIASFHFGKEDSSFDKVKKNKFSNLLFFLKGSTIVLAPLYTHPTETLKIFDVLNVEFSNINSDVVVLLLGFSFLSNFFINEKVMIALIDFFTVFLLNFTFTPLVAFTIYFCFLHSVRHTFSLIIELNKKNFIKGFKDFIVTALPLTLITAILFLISVYFLVNYYVLSEAILKVIFIGLASLTFPHILLEYIIEKNEK